MHGRDGRQGMKGGPARTVGLDKEPDASMGPIGGGWAMRCPGMGLRMERNTRIIYKWVRFKGKAII